MTFNLKKRKHSRKDYSSHKTLGLGVASLPINFQLPISILNQGATEDCTAYSGVTTRNFELTKTFDPIQFYNDECSFSNLPITYQGGFDLNIPASTAIKTGFVELGQTQHEGNPSAYLWITPNNGLDLFDSVRQVIFTQNKPVVGGLEWETEWGTEITTMGGNIEGGHAITIAGWKFENGITYMGLANSWGQGSGDNGWYWISRDVFNNKFTDFGIYYWIDTTNIKIKTLGLLSSLLLNLWNLIKGISGSLGYPPVTPVTPTKSVTDWANAIAKAEGAKPELNNPGDLKLSSLTKSWGASAGFQASDGGWIASFVTYEQGFQALVNFLTLGVENELLAFHKSRTLGSFMNVFAGNPPQEYLNLIAETLGVSLTFNINGFKI